MKQHRDFVTYVRNGVALNALVAFSRQIATVEHLTVVYLDPASASAMPTGEQMRNGIKIQSDVPPLVEGAVNGWKEVEDDRIEQEQAGEPVFTGVFDRGEALGPERFAAVSNGVTIWNFATSDEAQSYLAKYQAGNAPPQPSAADLDAHAAEQKAKEATKAAQQVPGDPAAENQAQGATELVIETKEYTDGTTATGVAPLPDLSPAQQDAKV